jgi:hypothetical protein
MECHLMRRQLKVKLISNGGYFGWDMVVGKVVPATVVDNGVCISTADAGATDDASKSVLIPGSRLFLPNEYIVMGVIYD